MNKRWCWWKKANLSVFFLLHLLYKPFFHKKEKRLVYTVFSLTFQSTRVNILIQQDRAALSPRPSHLSAHGEALRRCNKFGIQLTQVNFDLSVAQHKRVVIISAYITVLRNNVHSCSALPPNSKPLSVLELLLACLFVCIDLYQAFCSPVGHIDIQSLLYQ